MSERKTWLERWIGKGDADETRDGLQKTQGLLDKAGVERKSITIAQKDVHALAEAVAERIVGKMEEAGVIDAAVQSNAAADIQKPNDVRDLAAEAALEVIEEVAEEPGEEKSEDEKEKSQVSELLESNKELAESIADMLEDQGEMAKGYVELVTVLKGLAENDAEFMARVEKLEGLVSSRPRQASKADDTIFEHEKVEASAKEALTGELLVLGIPVKE